MRRDTRTLDYLTHIRVRFCEVDSLRIAWHGHYVTWLEEAREAHGRYYGLSYQDVEGWGYASPIVHLHCDYLMPARHGEVLDILTRLEVSEYPELRYHYSIRRADDLLCRAESRQVFVDKNWDLVITHPPPLSEVFRRWVKGDP